MTKPVVRISDPAHLTLIPLQFLDFAPEESAAIMLFKDGRLMTSCRIDLEDLFFVNFTEMFSYHVESGFEAAVVIYTRDEHYENGDAFKFIVTSLADLGIDSFYMAETDYRTVTIYSSPEAPTEVYPFPDVSHLNVPNLTVTSETLTKTRDQAVSEYRRNGDPDDDQHLLGGLRAAREAQNKLPEDRTHTRADTIRSYLSRTEELHYAEVLDLIAWIDRDAALEVMYEWDDDLPDTVIDRLKQARQSAVGEFELEPVAMLGYALWMRGGGAGVSEMREQLKAMPEEHPVGYLLEVVMTHGIKSDKDLLPVAVDLTSRLNKLVEDFESQL